MKGLFLHLGLLALAAVLAIAIWTREEPKASDEKATIQIWGGTADAIESVRLEGEKTKVELTTKKDALGRYYVGKVKKEQPAPAHPPMGSAAPPPPAPPRESRFVGVKAAGELVDRLAPLMAVRSLGRVDPKREGEFGLDHPDATIKVKVGGVEQVLKLGDRTPGGGERYAKYLRSGEIFAIPSDLGQSLEFADSRLMERSLHGFEASEITKATLTRRGKSRTVVKVADKQDAWADAKTPDKPDETVVNFMTKLDRLRPLEHVEKPDKAPGPDDALIRVEYFEGSKPSGFLEIYKIPGDTEELYLGRTEYVRWYVKLIASTAEQVDRDADALFK